MNFGGRLTLSPGQPELSSDQIGRPTLWYSPINGGTIPIQGVDTPFLSGPTDQNGWSVSVAGLAVGKYHVFGSSGGLVVGPAWTDPAAGLTRYNGVLVDSVTLNPWLGSINVSIAGQLTCHVGQDYDRKFEVYNAYNQKTIFLRVITQERDYTYCPTNQYPAWQPFNNNPLNRATVFTGKPEAVEVKYTQQSFLNTLSGAYGIINAVGWNGSAVGKWSGGTQDATYFAGGITAHAHYANAAAVGANTATMFVAAAVNSANRTSAIDSAAGPVWGYNAEANSFMLVSWQG